MDSLHNHTVPINVFTGYMGAGKTTVIYNTIKSLRLQSPDIKIAWLKNEFGVNQIDTLLANELHRPEHNDYNDPTVHGTNQTAVTGVIELLNGCICCTLIGQLSDAVYTLLHSYHADRIIIESSGTASPMSMIHELQRITSTECNIRVDSVICVVDLLNYHKNDDVSYSAKLQAKYNDVILLNKYELLLQKYNNHIEPTEQYIDTIVDDINEINDRTTKIRTVNGTVDPTILYDSIQHAVFPSQPDDQQPHIHDGSHDHNQHVVVLNWSNTGQLLRKQVLIDWLDGCDGDTYYRIKGVMLLQNNDGTQDAQLINYAFGHYTMTVLHQPIDRFALTIILRHSIDISFISRSIIRELQLNDTQNSLVPIS